MHTLCASFLLQHHVCLLCNQSLKKSNHHHSSMSPLHYHRIWWNIHKNLDSWTTYYQNARPIWSVFCVKFSISDFNHYDLPWPSTTRIVHPSWTYSYLPVIRCSSLHRHASFQGDKLLFILFSSCIFSLPPFAPKPRYTGYDYRTFICHVFIRISTYLTYFCPPQPSASTTTPPWKRGVTIHLSNH